MMKHEEILTYSDLEKDIEELYADSEKISSDVDNLSERIKTFNSLNDLILDYINKIKEYNRNIKQLDKLMINLTDEDKFACGSMFCNYISAFEGLVHDLIEMAAKMINEGILTADFSEKKRETLKKETINRPKKILEICNKYLGLQIQYDSSKIKKYSNSIGKTRNAFVHHNGYANDDYKTVTIKDINKLREHLHYIIELIHKNINEKIEKEFNEKLLNIM